MSEHYSSGFTRWCVDVVYDVQTRDNGRFEEFFHGGPVRIGLEFATEHFGVRTEYPLRARAVAPALRELSALCAAMADRIERGEVSFGSELPAAPVAQIETGGARWTR